ncbi:hypothetical protein BRARA_J02634 [Brassica rapa]|uniref:RING-CH-type domain-containing protein n=2 Tax=Brassica TaxID=3705 RepID=M4CY41_BRACM|nr:uncharacterized protein LOC103846923 [Brassica rapa]XP_013715692.2 uncharacterized protein LOC106419452 [Brassica napus]KAH0907851.1 hypothetical protein HID58_039678 [Brassica napus]RID42773.1 hypothetical protein BRARA_J02634 [Brassica rapa]CAF2359012.1 unnamed protein product [Brassica napus]
MEPVQPHLDTLKAIHVEDHDQRGKELVITDNNVEPRRSCSCAEEEDEERRSNASLCSVEVDLELGRPEKAVHFSEKDCRICHMTLDATNLESGVGIELGCSCKDDLAAAHKHCAETWFKIKGNKICEVCGSIAGNVEAEIEESRNEVNGTVNQSLRTVGPPLVEARSFWQGHRFLNFLLACMVFAFVISWLFHFNVPST